MHDFMKSTMDAPHLGHYYDYNISMHNKNILIGPVESYVEIMTRNIGILKNVQLNIKHCRITYMPILKNSNISLIDNSCFQFDYVTIALTRRIYN